MSDERPVQAPRNRTMRSSRGHYRPGVYQPSIDGLRALAIVSVLLYHDDHLIPGGYLGVDIFFVLSGFLITSLLFDEWQRQHRVDLRRFYLRRALRLFPALGVLLAVATIFAIAFPDAPQSPHIWRGVGYSLIYMTNWANLRDPLLLGPLSHTWSLAIEEQFYLLWPLLLVGLLRLTRGRRALFFSVLGLAVASAAWRLILSLLGGSAWRLYIGTDTRADSLLVGCAAAVLMSDARFLALARRSPHTVALAVIGGMPICWLMVGTPLEWAGYGMGVFLVVAVGAAAILIAVLSRPESMVARLLSTLPFVWVGQLSYSLYLWHYPIYGLIKPDRLGISAGVSGFARIVCAFGAAVGSFYLIERPFLRLKGRLSSTTRID